MAPFSPYSRAKALGEEVLAGLPGVVAVPSDLGAGRRPRGDPQAGVAARVEAGLGGRGRDGSDAAGAPGERRRRDRLHRADRATRRPRSCCSRGRDSAPASLVRIVGRTRAAARAPRRARAAVAAAMTVGRGWRRASPGRGDASRCCGSGRQQDPWLATRGGVASRGRRRGVEEAVVRVADHRGGPGSWAGTPRAGCGPCGASTPAGRRARWPPRSLLRDGSARPTWSCTWPGSTAPSRTRRWSRATVDARAGPRRRRRRRRPPDRRRVRELGPGRARQPLRPRQGGRPPRSSARPSAARGGSVRRRAAAEPVRRARAPDYNSFVATFAHAVVAEGGRPSVAEDREIPLLHAQDAAAVLIDAMAGTDDVRSGRRASRDGSPTCWRCSRRCTRCTPRAARSRPDRSRSSVDLFNTYRSRVFPDVFPMHAAGARRRAWRPVRDGAQPRRHRAGVRLDDPSGPDPRRALPPAQGGAVLRRAAARPRSALRRLLHDDVVTLPARRRAPGLRRHADAVGPQHPQRRATMSW